MNGRRHNDQLQIRSNVFFFVVSCPFVFSCLRFLQSEASTFAARYLRDTLGRAGTGPGVYPTCRSAFVASC